ncbi:MAG: GNAT family N-acetyltransferase [Bacteroidetes bacterium]|nr:MAG: GNAT family N-acetyltransferase [Bacteroidota bacterium]
MHLKTVDYKLTTDTPPAHYKFSYDQNLYHRIEYLECQSKLPGSTFWLCDHPSAQIHGVIHFHLEGSRAVSHAYAPFGSFDGKIIPNNMVENFISYITKTLIKHGLKQMQFNQPAPFYSAGSGWAQVLRSLGFSVRHSINHHVIVDKFPLRDKMHLMEKRKLTRCEEFCFKLQPLSFFSRIYQFIKACRQERNQSLSMSFESLEKVIRKLPANFLLCTASYGNTLAAAAIVIKVTSRCWYQFYPAHNNKFNRESPLVFLMSELYAHARKEGVEIIDLGTSEDQGLPNKGLLTFKKRIGGITTMKSSYFKTI